MLSKIGSNNWSDYASPYSSDFGSSSSVFGYDNYSTANNGLSSIIGGGYPQSKIGSNNWPGGTDSFTASINTFLQPTNWQNYNTPSLLQNTNVPPWQQVSMGPVEDFTTQTPSSGAYPKRPETTASAGGASSSETPSISRGTTENAVKTVVDKGYTDEEARQIIEAATKSAKDDADLGAMLTNLPPKKIDGPATAPTAPGQPPPPATKVDNPNWEKDFNNWYFRVVKGVDDPSKASAGDLRGDSQSYGLEFVGPKVLNEPAADDGSPGVVAGAYDVYKIVSAPDDTAADDLDSGDFDFSAPATDDLDFAGGSSPLAVEQQIARDSQGRLFVVADDGTLGESLSVDYYLDTANKILWKKASVSAADPANPAPARSVSEILSSLDAASASYNGSKALGDQSGDGVAAVIGESIRGCFKGTQVVCYDPRSNSLNIVADSVDDAKKRELETLMRSIPAGVNVLVNGVATTVSDSNPLAMIYSNLRVSVQNKIEKAITPSNAVPGTPSTPKVNADLCLKGDDGTLELGLDINPLTEDEAAALLACLKSWRGLNSKVEINGEDVYLSADEDGDLVNPEDAIEDIVDASKST